MTIYLITFKDGRRIAVDAEYEVAARVHAVEKAFSDGYAPGAPGAAVHIAAEMEKLDIPSCTNNGSQRAGEDSCPLIRIGQPPYQRDYMAADFDWLLPKDSSPAAAGQESVSRLLSPPESWRSAVRRLRRFLGKALRRTTT